jgi:hypothetical protein
MRGIRTLFLAVIIALGAIVSSAQITVFVRSAADGGNNANNGLTAATAKLTIGGANGALAVAGITTLDVGAGDFAGATTTVPLTINGANAGAAFANWGAATVFTTPFTLGAADADLVVEGVTFGAGSTINGASTGANVIVSNCKFSAADAVNTTGLGWEELSVSGCQFDGNNGGAAANAIIGNGLTTLFLTETTFEDYTSSAVTVSGSHENVVLTSNEFTGVNTGGTTSEGAMKIDAAGLSTTGSLRLANNIVVGGTNGVVVSGSISGKTINVESNLFSGLAGFAIRNNGTGMLAAGCNAYGPNASITTVMGLLNGAIQAGPYNFGAIDDNGAGIGFIPQAGSCTADGPVTITGSTNSYFRIQDGVSAVSSGGTVTAGEFTYTENVNVNKSLTLTAVNGVDDYTRATPWATLNGTITVTIGAVNFNLTGFKVTSTTATQLVTSSATGSTNILNCLLDVNPTLGLSAVPANGAIHILKNGDVNINGTKVGRPTSGTAPFIRALTFGAGNACRNVSIGTASSNLFEGTLQFSGMSLLSSVTINNSQISNAGIDGVSFTGNTINQLSIAGCDILNSRQNGIGIRDRVTVGNVSASISNNEITGSGQSGSGFAAVSISSTSFGTQSYTGNILAPQSGSNKLFINDRSGYNPTATCNWWGSKSQDVIEANNTGSVVLDNGADGWYRDNASIGGNGANFDGGSGATCTVRAFTITLAPSNATCFGSSTGSINNTLAGTTAGAAFTWSNGAITEDVSNLAAGTYSVTVTTASENTRSRAATILEPTQLTGTTAKTNITCFSLVDGTITVSNPAGGVINGITPTYNYRIDRAGGAAGDVGPQGSASFTGLGAGTYDVYIIAVGASPTCERVIGTQVIVEPTQINGSGSVTSNYNGAQISCPAATDGQITITASGGTGSLEYKLGSGSYQASNVFGGLGAGTYMPTVKDANGCERILANVVITAPTQISGSGSVTSSYFGAQISCPGLSDGQITITASGGTGTLNYKLNGGSYQVSDIFNGLAAGTYTPTVKDANDCEKVLTAVVITDPTPITGSGAVTSNYNGAQISCPTSTDGIIVITATGGTSTLQYKLNSGSYQVSSTFSGLGAGTYTPTVKDANNCEKVLANVVITAPVQLTVASAVKKSYNGVDLSCHNSTDGEITVTAAGGTGAKTYSINNGGTYQSGTVFSSLAAGTYNVKIKDANNCETAATQVVITAPVQLTVASAVKTQYNGVDLSCHNSTDGEITVTAAGGTGAKQYSINNGGAYQSGTVFSNLAAGTYQIKIKDANNCETAATEVVITAPVQLTVASAVKTQYNGADLSCHNSTDGEITVTAAGGTGAKQYSIDNGGAYQSGTVFSNLAAGTYNVRIKDANNCVTAATQVVIVAPTQLTVASAVKTQYNGADLSCHNSTNGEITVTAAGGTGAKTYSINNGGAYQSGTVFSNLAAGTYNVKIKDANNCVTAATQVVIVAPTQLTVASAVKKSYNGADLSCHNSTDGEITVTAAGGTGAKTYSINNGGTYQSGTVFSSLAAGTYNVKIKDANNCETAATQVVITAPVQLTVASAVKTQYNGADLSCHNSTDGEITVTSAGGTGTKQYSGNNGSSWQASNIFSGLAAGTYQIKIKDANNCETAATEVVITAPVQLTVASAVKTQYNGADLSCHNSTDGEITVTAAGGTGAKQYSINNGGAYQSGTVFSNLAAGTYNVRIKDANDCVTAATQVVIVAPTQLTVASAVKTSYNGADLSCHNSTDGEITVTAAGGTGAKTYSINNGGAYQSGTVFSNLAAGTYNVKIKDANNCVTAATQVVIVAPTQLTVASAVKKSYNGADLSCHNSTDGEITVTAAGGTGAKTYSINNGGTYQSGTVFSSLAAGTYNVKIKDANNCETAATQVVITAPVQLTVASAVKTQYNGADLSCHNSTDGEITVTSAGGTGTKQYSGNNGSSWQASNIFSGLAAGTYQIKIKDANNCETAATEVVITAPVQLTVASAVKTQYNGADLSCHNSTDGEITVTAAGGTGAKQYSINNGGAYQSGTVFSNLAAGTYNVRIKDANNCETAATQVVIVAPTQLTVASAVKTQYNGRDLSCHNSTDGEITVTAAGGTGAKQYSNNNGATWQASNIFSNLAAGSYQIRIRDVNSCTTAVTNVTIIAPPAITSAPAVTSNYNGAQLTCPNSSDGVIAANAGGGTPGYTYLWQKFNGTTWGSPGAMNATLATITNVNAGTYRVTVTDVNLCAITNAVEVIPPAQAVILTVTKTPASSFNGRDVSCFGASDGTVTVVATGGTGNLKYSSNGGTTWLTGGTLTPGGEPTYTFTGLGAGTYTVIVQDVNGCNSDPQSITLLDPPLLQIASLVTNGPVNAGESMTFTATVVGGTRSGGVNKYSYAWQKPRPAANMPGFGSETVNVNDVVTTFTIPVTTPDDNGFNTNYILTVTDANGCTAVLSVTPIIYPPTIHVATTGNDATGDGRPVNPLRTIQKANDVADPNNTIEVAAGVFDESPVITKALTVNGTNTTVLGTGRYFVYGTPNTITWGTSWPTSVWDNLGLNGDASSAIGTVMAKVNSNANATMWLIGNIAWNGTITVSKQLAIRGATASAAVPSYTGCDIAPPTTITYTGTGADTVLFKFTGTTTKSIRDLVLQVPFAGRFIEIAAGNSCDVDPVTNVRFDWDHDNNALTDRRRLYGVTNGSFSVNQTFDVAKLIHDVTDNSYGSGRVVYGDNGPLPWNSLEIGWKAEDGGVEVAGEKIKTLEPMKSTVKLQSLISNGRRPALNTTAGNYNGKWSMDFDATANQYLEANTTAEINGGSKKTVFVVFRPLDGADNQIIYKHGDQTNGMSLVHLADGRISMNIYDGTAVDKRESWIFESAASSHSETGFDNEVLIAQMYFNGDGTNNATRRVGASLDRESGRIDSDVNHTGADKTNGYVSNAAFTSATLTTPAVIGPANVAVLGARSGSIYYATWNGTASVDNSVTSTGRSLFYNGSIAEVLIMNTASESIRDAAYCYLRNKYYGGTQTTQNGLDKRAIAGDKREDMDAVSAWPNPADDRVSIETMIPTSGMVTVTLRDALGRVAQVLHEDYVSGGTLLPVTADVRNLVSGAYVIHVSAAGDVNHSLPVIIRH